MIVPLPPSKKQHRLATVAMVAALVAGGAVLATWGLWPILTRLTQDVVETAEAVSATYNYVVYGTTRKPVVVEIGGEKLIDGIPIERYYRVWYDLEINGQPVHLERVVRCYTSVSQSYDGRIGANIAIDPHGIMVSTTLPDGRDLVVRSLGQACVQAYKPSREKKQKPLDKGELTEWPALFFFEHGKDDSFQFTWNAKAYQEANAKFVGGGFEKSKKDATRVDSYEWFSRSPGRKIQYNVVYSVGLEGEESSCNLDRPKMAGPNIFARDVFYFGTLSKSEEVLKKEYKIVQLKEDALKSSYILEANTVDLFEKKRKLAKLLKKKSINQYCNQAGYAVYISGAPLYTGE